jgi:hypothetical protein
VKTRTELIHRTLRNLGVLPQGQSPSAEESQSIDDLIDPTLAELKVRQVTLVDISGEAIDDEFFMPLGRIMAAAAAPEFGQSQDQAIWALKERAELDLKKMTAARYTGIVLENTYY